MQILLCPDSFKGAFTAAQAAAAFARGVRQAYPQARTIELPLADGGEGTLEVLLEAAGGKLVPALAADPLGRPVEAAFALLGEGSEALVEMARASGLHLLMEQERDPWSASTRGTGMLIAAALERGARALALTLGGSATVEGGTGMARALGFRFYDSQGQELTVEGGRLLARIARIDAEQVDPRLAGLPVRALCDVNNPLLGERGAARVFGPQKGAGPELVEHLEEGLANLARRCEEDLGRNITELPGGGAAGGLGAGVAAFLGGKLVPGIDYVLEQARFESKLDGCALAITGEGAFDSQSLGGKVVSGVWARARRQGVPLAVVCGRAAVSVEPEHPGELLKVWSGADLAKVTGPGGFASLEDLAELASRAACYFLGSGGSR